MNALSSFKCLTKAIEFVGDEIINVLNDADAKYVIPLPVY